VRERGKRERAMLLVVCWCVCLNYFFSCMCASVCVVTPHVLSLISPPFSPISSSVQGGPGSPSESAFNGAGTMRLGKHTEFIPGSVISCDDSGFVKAYVAMCDRSEVSFAKAVEMRHKMLLARQGTAQAQDDDEEELAVIGQPVGDEGSAERKAWYEAWAQERREGGGGGGGGLADDPMAALAAMSGGGGAGPGGQMQMMQMLMGMMQGGGGMGGPQKPDDGRRVRVADLELLQR
jgi:hypothetical protein